MDPSFSLKGIELGKLALSSGLLESSWSKILEIQNSSYPNQDTALGFKIHKEEKFTFVAFAAPPSSRNGSINSASTLLPGPQIPNPFPFLCSEKISSFSIHTPTFELFSSAYEDLIKLKTELLESKKPVIITGAGLGGSVASLFTLWLLETVDPGQKRLLCITFGSPLIGDASLQQILENSVRNSCFLHVAQPKTHITEGFKSFGTFLICDGSECICIDDPEVVTELLNGVNTNLDLVNYGDILHHLNQSVLSTEDSLLISDDVIVQMDDRAWKKKTRFNPVKKLNDMKLLMVYLEWYKKKSKEAEIGYYDKYRLEIQTTVNINVEGWKKEMNNYWILLVEEVEKKPQSDVSILSRRFLFSGNNYRRIVEPLDIAEYYGKDDKEYRTLGRSRHYVMLEKWFGKESIKTDRDKKRDLSSLLTFDSCFWAEVEEAMIVINQLKAVEGMRDEELIGKLVKFEEYAWKMIGERAVSPEIFLEKSSFMSWWKEYEEMEVNSSAFTEYMVNKTYNSYGNVVA
ncbi:hypothetical protein AALP_AAs72314U000100 [Arabis alpina]|uniref:Senescence-associated carboxylesterase 101 n=1 Tax=Arabis alpina TaxID=50452 RepID=A0A087G1G8_ARAAL|nr:hypothetical protein AALP_AAs72314U000100 [Arabis alpina]